MARFARLREKYLRARLGVYVTDRHCTQPCKRFRDKAEDGQPLPLQETRLHAGIRYGSTELDGRVIAKFAPASYVFLQVEPGQHFLVTGVGVIPIKVIRLEAGRTYFLKADFSGTKWDEVSEQEGRADISKLKRVKTFY